MDWSRFLTYLLVMAGVTYLIRMLPLAAIRGRVRSVFLQSFLYYVPYAVLGAMTFPAVFSAGKGEIRGWGRRNKIQRPFHGTDGRPHPDREQCR